MTVATKTKSKRKPLISVKGLHKTYHPPGGTPYTALRGIDAAIYPGEFVVVIGPSGCGKTTFIHTLVGLEGATKGSVKYRDWELTKLSEEKRSVFRAKRIGIIYQMQYWVKSMNVIQNVCMPLFIAGMSEGEAMKQAWNALEEVKMTHMAYKRPMQLSGGEQQIVGFARAIVNHPKIIVADEPTGNLDTSNADRIISLLHYYNKERKVTVIMVTHSLSYLTVADRKIAFRDGKVVNVEEELQREVGGAA